MLDISKGRVIYYPVQMSTLPIFGCFDLIETSRSGNNSLITETSRWSLSVPYVRVHSVIRGKWPYITGEISENRRTDLLSVAMVESVAKLKIIENTASALFTRFQLFVAEV